MKYGESFASTPGTTGETCAVHVLACHMKAAGTYGGAQMLVQLQTHAVHEIAVMCVAVSNRLKLLI